MRIIHLSFSRSGGAGGVASRLAELQRERGHDSRVVSAISGSLRDAPLATPAHTIVAATDDYLARQPSFAAPISLYRDRLSTLLKAEIEAADVIHLHWVNGFVDFDELALVIGNKPVVWTLHDMNPFTGACHYSLGCEGFVNSCEKCPAVRSAFQSKVAGNLRAKKSAVEALPHLKLVSPSSWLADHAMSSAVFAGRPVTVIPNPLATTTFGDLSREQSRHSLGIGEGAAAVFALSASQLDDPVKAARVAIEAFGRAFSSRDDVHLLVMGRGATTAASGVTYLGYVSPEMSQKVFAASDYLIVPSRAENQPLVISEAQSMGTSIIVRNDTGLPEHLDIDPLGRLFTTDDELGEVLRQAVDAVPSARQRSALAQKARKKFDPQSIAAAYEAIYTSH